MEFWGSHELVAFEILIAERRVHSKFPTLAFRNILASSVICFIEHQRIKCWREERLQNNT